MATYLFNSENLKITFLNRDPNHFHLHIVTFPNTEEKESISLIGLLFLYIKPLVAMF